MKIRIYTVTVFNVKIAAVCKGQNARGIVWIRAARAEGFWASESRARSAMCPKRRREGKDRACSACSFSFFITANQPNHCTSLRRTVFPSTAHGLVSFLCAFLVARMTELDEAISVIVRLIGDDTVNSYIVAHMIFRGGQMRRMRVSIVPKSDPCGGQAVSRADARVSPKNGRGPAYDRLCLFL